MSLEKHDCIWTIGHSTHSWDAFVALLHQFEIQLLIDVRHYPGSKRYPHFNKEHMEHVLPSAGIQYLHLVHLGGRRKPLPHSVNTGWQHNAFRGYADHMQTHSFKNAADVLQKEAKARSTAFMCSEAVWWSCHRSLLSDYLKIRGWTVLHIMGQKVKEHPYTSPARIEDGQLKYSDPELF